MLPKHALRVSFALAALALLASFATITWAEEKKAEEAKKADATGVWVWEAQGRNNQTRTVKLTLKQEGDKLTGFLPGREDTKIEIADGKVVGNKISFTITREFNNNKVVNKYSGTVEADTIKGKIETERNGEAREPRDWEAKREKEEKKEEKKAE